MCQTVSTSGITNKNMKRSKKNRHLALWGNNVLLCKYLLHLYSLRGRIWQDS